MAGSTMRMSADFERQTGGAVHRFVLQFRFLDLAVLELLEFAAQRGAREDGEFFTRGSLEGLRDGQRSVERGGPAGSQRPSEHGACDQPC